MFVRWTRPLIRLARNLYLHMMHLIGGRRPRQSMEASLSEGEAPTVGQEGEALSPTFEIVWVEVGGEIGAGQTIAPMYLTATALTEEYSGLHLCVEDLRLAHSCLVEAVKFGIPDSSNHAGRALIHAGIISYARPFATGVRSVRLSPGYFAEIWTANEADLHQYLYTMRQKHIAHSVNNFEQAITVGIVIVDESHRLLTTNPSGIGVMKLSMVGLPMAKLRECPDHIAQMISRIERRIAELRPEIHAEMRPMLSVGDQIKLAPMTIPDRSKVSERRS